MHYTGIDWDCLYFVSVNGGMMWMEENLRTKRLSKNSLHYFGYFLISQHCYSLAKFTPPNVFLITAFSVWLSSLILAATLMTDWWTFSPVCQSRSVTQWVQRKQKVHDRLETETSVCVCVCVCLCAHVWGEGEQGW